MNWGKGLAIAMTLFILFILSFVYRAMQDNDSLYEQDYYDQGEAHTSRMEAEEVAADVDISFNNQVVTVDLGEPGSLESLKLKCMKDSKFDRQMTNTTETDLQKSYSIETGELVSGIWYAEARGKINGKDYLKKQQLIIP